MKLLFKALQNAKEIASDEHNSLGWKTVEIIAFNFDGKGNAIIIHDGKPGICSDEEIRTIILSGFYELVKP